MSTPFIRRQSLYWSLFAAAALFLFAVASYMVVEEEEIPSSSPQADYEILYPYYVEICSVSRFKPFKAPEGGAGGHAVVYLKGVCRDEGAPYPAIGICEEGSVDLTDPQSGVGVSVDKMFRNVNWIAVPGKELFIHGNLRSDDVLDQAHLEATVREATDLGLFRGVDLHPEYLSEKGAGESLEEFIARQTAGTDYAIKFARSSFCLKLPVTRPMLEKTVEFLNELNSEYAQGRAEYNWSSIHDNCTHTIHNALTAAGIWEPKSVRLVKILQIFNLAIPANEFVNLAILSNDHTLEDRGEIYGDKIQRSCLLEMNWLPTRHGALLSTVGAHRKNEIFDPHFEVRILQYPYFRFKSKAVRRMFEDERYYDTEMNLIHFKGRYERILRGRPGGESSPDGPRAALDEAYYAYVDQQLKDVILKLNTLSEIRKRPMP